MTTASTMLTMDVADGGEIAIITLNKPPVNAWAQEDYVELSRLIDTINRSDDIRVAVLRAEGRMFSAGADVKRLAADDAAAGARRRPILRRVAEDIANCEVPLIAAIHGNTVGAGTAFVAAADMIVASPECAVSIPEINVGVVGAGAAMRRLVPENKVRALAFTAGSISGQELHALGSVEVLAAREDLYNAAMDLARKVAAKGYLAVRKWKEALNRTDPNASATAFMIEQCLGQELSLLSPPPSI